MIIPPSGRLDDRFKPQRQKLTCLSLKCQDHRPHHLLESELPPGPQAVTLNLAISTSSQQLKDLIRAIVNLQSLFVPYLQQQRHDHHVQKGLRRLSFSLLPLKFSPRDEVIYQPCQGYFFTTISPFNKYDYLFKLAFHLPECRRNPLWI